MTMTLIGTSTVGAGGSGFMDFINIPQTYTDLLLVVSARTGWTGIYQQLEVYFNDVGTNYFQRALLGSGNSVFNSNNAWFEAGSNGNGATANTFSNAQFYIPNYTANTAKTISFDSVAENNGTNGYLSLVAGYWNNTAAINKIYIGGAGQTFVQNSTATLYGITKGSGGATVS